MVAEDKKTWAALAIIAGIVLVAAVLGGISVIFADWQWYDKLFKPVFTPPNSLFGPVWAVLYATLAVAAWLIWREVEWEDAKLPLTVFGVQLFLNAIWTSLFFAMRSPGAALIDITLLLFAIIAMTFLFFRIKILGGVLLLPYLAWVSFAWIINLTIWKWN